jgi:hypothetical protein
MVPPRFDVLESSPLRRVKIGKTQPLLNVAPNSDSEAAFEEKVGRRLDIAIAKGAVPTIGTTSGNKPVSHPHPVLKNEPGEEFTFWGGPILPNSGIHISADETLKLRFVGGGSRVRSRSRELPRNGIQSIISKLHPGSAMPKLNCLLNVLNREPVGQVELVDPGVVRDSVTN